MKSTHLLFLIFILCGMALSATAEEKQQNCNVVAKKLTITPIGDSEAKALYSSIAKPTSFIELLKNTKIIITNNLLMREDFFTEDNLKNFFGGEEIEWSGKIPTSVYKSGYVRKLNYMKSNDSIDFNYYKTIDHKFDILGKKKARLIIGYFGVMPFNYRDIKNIFGEGVISNIFDKPMYQNGHGVPIPRVTSPMGNKEVNYELNELSNQNSSFYVDFTGDGTFLKMNIYLEEK